MFRQLGLKHALVVGDETGRINDEHPAIATVINANCSKRSPALLGLLSSLPPPHSPTIVTFCTGSGPYTHKSDGHQRRMPQTRLTIFTSLSSVVMISW